MTNRSLQSVAIIPLILRFSLNFDSRNRTARIPWIMMQLQFWETAQKYLNPMWEGLWLEGMWGRPTLRAVCSFCLVTKANGHIFDAWMDVDCKIICKLRFPPIFLVSFFLFLLFLFREWSWPFISIWLYQLKPRWKCVRHCKTLLHYFLLFVDISYVMFMWERVDT